MFIKTKRFAYDVLKEYYDYCEKTKTISYFNGCTTVLGARKVGKTILLKQLCEIEPSKSYYMDCTDMPETFDFESFYEECLSKGVSRVFLDEVCKVPDDIIADFIESTKLYSAKILITITGSVKLSVSKLSSRIGRGRTIELPPISYTEQIGWEGISSSPELLLNFLRSGNIDTLDNTIDSYQIDSRLENELMLRMTYLYRVVDKYRDLDSNELDIVYTVGDCFDSGIYFIRPQSGVSANVQNSDIRHYLSLKTSLNLNELVISCSDKTEVSDDYSFVRNDILLTALDKAYFKRCHDDFLGDSCGLYCNKSVLKLIARQS